MKYKTVKNLRWANSAHTIIDCEVDFDDLSEEFVPFSASESGMYEHERDIFQKAKAGQFGSISNYAPIVLTKEQKAGMYRYRRDELLKELDSIVSNPLRWGSFSDQKKQEFDKYRQALLGVPQQSGFPDNIVWPVCP